MHHLYGHLHNVHCKCTLTYCKRLEEIWVICMDPETQKWYTDEIKRMGDEEKKMRDLIEKNGRKLSGKGIV